MNHTLPALLLLLTAPFAAQGRCVAQKDEITWRDGTKTRSVKVVEFTGRHLVYNAKSGKETAEAHRVRSLVVEDWSDPYKKDKEPDHFYATAEDQLKAGNKGAAQYGYWQAGMLFLEDGKVGSAIAALEKLDKAIPESGFAPSLYVVKLQHYLSDPKSNNLANAFKVAEAYEAEAQKRGWDVGFELEAKFYQKLSSYMQGKTKGPDALVQFQDLANAASGKVDFVSDLAKVQAADMQRAEKKDKEAMVVYEELLKRQTSLEPNTLARTLLGVGYIRWQEALAGNNAEASHDAYVTFLKVYLLARDANADYVAEGLYCAARAAEKWNGLPSSRAEAARLRSRLRSVEPYKSTSWAKK